MKKVYLTVAIIATSLLTGCMTFNNSELPITKPPKPTNNKIIIEKKVGKFHQKLNGEGTSRGGSSNKSNGTVVLNAILSQWCRKGLIEDYDEIGDLGETKPDYTLKLNGYKNEDMSWLGSIFCGLSFFIIPSSSTLEYNLELILKDNKTLKTYTVKANNSMTMWMEILFLPAFPIFWLGNHNMWVDTSLYIYNEFYKQGAFVNYYKEGVKK